jgi:putative heme iron utilization protein
MEDPLSVGETSSARQARCYLRARSHGVLSTLSRRLAGYPYGSIVPFMLDHEGRPVILVSRLAEHTRNMEADGRASLVARDDGDDVQAGTRLTLVGEAGRFDCGHHLHARFLRYQPKAEQLLRLEDFSFWRIAPVALRFIAGFGAIRWVTASEFTAPRSEIEGAEAEILSCVNADHADALRGWSSRMLGSDVNAAAVLGVDCDGFDVVADGSRLRLDFPDVTTDPDSVRRTLIAMTESAPRA